MAEINIEKMGKRVAEEALDGYIYKGKTLKEWIDILAQTQWIPVSERLPEKNMECLVTVGDFNLVQTAMYSNLMRTIDHRIFYQGECGDETFKNITQYVIAWMPLPEPYEPQESEEKQEQNRDEKMIDAIGFAIKATDSQDDYSMGMRNGMRYVKSLIDGKEPQYEFRRTDEEIKLGIDFGDEVIGDYGAKGVVVGIDTYKGEVLLSLLMKKHKVPQLVKASGYKIKTGRHFPQIREVLEQIKGETDGK